MENSRCSLLLNALSPERQRELHAETNDYALGATLIPASDVPEFVWFPHGGTLISIIRPTESGLSVESGVVSREGLSQVQSLLADRPLTGSEVIVQIEGPITRVDAARLRAVFREEPRFRDAVLAFSSFYIEQLTQNLVCGRLHAIEQRLARWLLVVRDLSERDDLHLTHDFLSHMLGIHRPGVSIAIAALETDGLIRHGRNRIDIRDVAGLERASCECYAVLCENLNAYRRFFSA